MYIYAFFTVCPFLGGLMREQFIIIYYHFPADNHMIYLFYLLTLCRCEKLGFSEKEDVAGAVSVSLLFVHQSIYIIISSIILK